MSDIKPDKYKALCEQLKPFSGRLVSLTPQEEAVHTQVVEKMKAYRLALVQRFGSSLDIKWALAIHLALETHEESYQTVDRLPDADLTAQLNGCYSKSYDDCCRQAVGVVGLPSPMWYPLMLQSDPNTGWANDSIDWADSVLSGTVDKDYPLTEPEPV